MVGLGGKDRFSVSKTAEAVIKGIQSSGFDMKKRSIVGVSNMSLGQSDRWGGGKFWHGRRDQCFECRAAYFEHFSEGGAI